MEIIEDSLVDAVRDLVGRDRAHIVDALRLTTDVRRAAVRMKLFDQKNVVGVFRGFSDSGMEFHADLVLPYRDELQSIPMHGQFVLVQLEHEDEAVLGRITSVAAEGRLVSPIGEDYAIRAVRDDRPIPDELRDQYLKYRVDIRVLGVERVAGDKLIFVPSHRRLPHVGAKVAFCSREVLAEVANAGSGECRAAPRSGSWRSASSSTRATTRGRRPKTGWSSCTRPSCRGSRWHSWPRGGASSSHGPGSASRT